MKRRDAYESDHDAFARKWSRQDGKLRQQVVKAREILGSIKVNDGVLEKAAEICIALETDGSRGELTLLRAARAYAALNGADRARAPVAQESARRVERRCACRACSRRGLW